MVCRDDRDLRLRLQLAEKILIISHFKLVLTISLRLFKCAQPLARSPLTLLTSLACYRKSRWQLSWKCSRSSLFHCFLNLQPSRIDQVMFLSSAMSLAKLSDISKVVKLTISLKKTRLSIKLKKTRLSSLLYHFRKQSYQAYYITLENKAIKLTISL